MRYISLTERLILNILLLGVVIIAILTTFSYYSAQSLLLKRTFEQLSSVRNLKKYQIESFFNERLKEITYLSELDEVKICLNYLNFNIHKTNVLQETNFSRHKHDTIKNNFVNYLNFNEYYSKAIITDVKKSVLIFDIKNKTTHRIKSLDNFDSLLVEFIDNVKIKRTTLLYDLKPNKKKRFYNVYLGSPIYDKTKNVIGCLLLEFPSEQIEKIMLESKHLIGLGKTGEIYLVGSDYLMRSVSRFFSNSVLSKKVNTVASRSAINGIEGAEVIEDYRNIKVLTAFTPVKIVNLKWALIAEIDLEEANIGVSKLRNYILFISIFSLLILFIATYLIALKISKPLVNLKNDVLKISMGGPSKPLLIGSNDEIGELKSAFNKLMSHLDMQNEQLQEERSLRLRSVIDGQEMERQRLSRELHDGLGQMLIAIKLKLEGLIYIDRSKLLYNISGIQKLFDSTIEEVKRISYDLSPAVLHEFGLLKAIRNLCDDVENRTKINIYLNFDCDTEKMSNIQQTYLFRIIQEALNNVVKHSEATTVKVDLKLCSNYISLVISDNGKGFNVAERIKTSQSRGIYNMKERVNLLNGEFYLKSEPGSGTTIETKIKL